VLRPLLKIKEHIIKKITRADMPLEVQISNVVCVAAILGSFAVSSIKIIEGAALGNGLFMIGAPFAALVCYVICALLKKNKPGVFFCYFWLCMVGVPGAFFTAGASYVSGTAYFAMTLVLAAFVFHGRDWIPWIIVQSLVILGCVTLSYHRPDLAVEYSARRLVHIDVLGSSFIIGLGIFGLVKFQIWAYRLQKEKADAASRAKAEFLATMSHEIRTPMNAIIGLQDSILKEPLSENQKKYMTNLRMSSFALLDIVNNILDFSKIDTGGVQIMDSDFNLTALLENIVTTNTMTAEKKGLVFKTAFSETLPKFLRGDEVKIRQILNNLLSNAIKYTPKGYVELAAFICSIGPDEESSREFICFEVKDSGIGIKAEDRNRVFSPFEQLDLRKNKGILGTGLGLSITRSFVRAMGGAIELESVYGKGSCFRVLLPYLWSDKQEEAPVLVKEVFFAPEAKVLVVDDVDINIMVAQAMLGEYKIVPDSALSGEEALEKAAAKEYDLVFMDQMMPGMDGIETTERLRKISAHYAAVPVVALTANVVNTSQEYFRDLGFNSFLYKPIETEKLFKCLTENLPQDKIV
jgi:signal transduction histidine kinase/ActR/RegA family two-component response regulator